MPTDGDGHSARPRPKRPPMCRCGQRPALQLPGELQPGLCMVCRREVEAQAKRETAMDQAIARQYDPATTLVLPFGETRRAVP